MATKEQDISKIRTATYGRDIREAIADALEKLPSTTSLSDGDYVLRISNGQVQWVKVN